MRNLFACFLVLVLLAVLVVTRLISRSYNTTGRIDLHHAFSAENVASVVVLLILAGLAFGVAYSFRRLLADQSRKLTKDEQAVEAVVTVMVAAVLMGVMLFSGLTRKVPYLKDMSIAGLSFQERPILCTVLVLGIAVLAAASYAVRIGIIGSDDNDDRDEQDDK